MARPRASVGLFGFATAMVLPSSAAAHIELVDPPARYGIDYQKDPPCGHPDNPDGTGEPTVYTAGQVVMIRLEEFVEHEGHFRVALDPTGTDTFSLPTSFDDFYSDENVLLDDVEDPPGGGQHELWVTLPDQPCDPCTLQVLQVMHDGEFGPGDSDLYFQCADIVIEAAASGGTDDGSGDGSSTGTEPPPETTGGSSTGTGSATSDDATSDEPGGDSTSEASTTAPSSTESAEGCSCGVSTRDTPMGTWLGGLWLLLAAARRRRQRA